MFSVLKKTRKLGFPVYIQLQMFDSMVTPILLYGSELFGYENCSNIKSVFLQFYKLYFVLRKEHQTTFYMESWVVTHQIFS